MADYTDNAFIPNIFLNGREGTAKLGILSVESQGRVAMTHPVTGLPRIAFDTENLPTIASLKNETSASGTGRFLSNMVESSPSGLSKRVLSGTMSMTRNMSDVSISGGSVLQLSGDMVGSGVIFKAAVNLLRNGSRVYTLAEVQLSRGIHTMDSILVHPITLRNMPSGTYTVELSLYTSGWGSNSKATASVGTINMSWNYTKAGVKLINFGLDGLMAFFSNNHFHFSEDKGLDVGGDVRMDGKIDLKATGGWNASGTLFHGVYRLSSFTSPVQRWSIDALKGMSVSRTNNTIRLNHNLGHTDYAVLMYLNGKEGSAGSGVTSANYCTVNLAGSFNDSHEATIIINGTYK